MDKKIGFIIWKLPMLKAYAPVMRELSLRGIDIFLFIIPLPNGKISEDLRGNGLLEFSKEVFQEKLWLFYCDDHDKLVKLLQDNDIGSLIITDFSKDTFGGVLEIIYKQQIKIFCLQWYGDFLEMGGDLLKYVSKLFVYSDYYVDYFLDNLDDDEKKLAVDKLLVVGNPLFDCTSNIKKNRGLLFKKYDLSPDTKIVLMMTQHLPYFESFGRFKLALKSVVRFDFNIFLKIIFAPSYKQIFKSIKNWCKENGAVLVVKSRDKHDEPDFVKKEADVFINDNNQWYPTVSLELMSVADLCIGVWSTSVIEAVYSRVYNITISPPNFSMPSDSRNNRFFSKELFEERGVTECYQYDKVLSFLRSRLLIDFEVDEESQQKYLGKFAGPTNGLASRRIVDYILND